MKNSILLTIAILTIALISPVFAGGLITAEKCAVAPEQLIDFTGDTAKVPLGIFEDGKGHAFCTKLVDGKLAILYAWDVNTKRGHQKGEGWLGGKWKADEKGFGKSGSARIKFSKNDPDVAYFSFRNKTNTTMKRIASM